MNVIGAVTASAAGLAAVLAGVNLYVSGRREQNRWTREALVEVFVAFMDASFKHSSICRTLTLLSSPPDLERQRLRAAVVAAHDLESDTLTRLRLLASSRLVTAAEALHEMEHTLAAVCFMKPLPTEGTLDSARVPVRRARAQVLEAARWALQLRDTAAISHRHEASWDEFRLPTQAPSQQKEASEPQSGPEPAGPGS